MMSITTIRDASYRAAARAAAEKSLPFVVWPEDLQRWRRRWEAGEVPGFPFPLLGYYVPEGYRLVRELFVDSSGLGQRGELALTVEEFLHEIQVDRAYALREVGEFQVVVGEYERVGREVAGAVER